MIKEFLQGFMAARKIHKEVNVKNYYTHIDDLPVYNFFKIAKGEYHYLFKNESDYNKPFSEDLFKYTFSEMYFQFKKLDNSFLRDKAYLAVYWSKWVVEKNYRWKNEYNTLNAKLTKNIQKELDINDFTDYIEMTFKQPVGSIDVHKVSTSKAFNNFNRAQEYNKKNSHVDN